MNTDKIIAESIAKEYAPKEHSKIIALKKLDALIALLGKKDFEYITIKEICDAAEVNRSTFYLHYENTTDLLKETTERILDSFLSYFSVDTQKISNGFNECELKDLLLITPEYIVPYIMLFNILTGTAVWLIVLLLGVNLLGGKKNTMAKSKIVKFNKRIAGAVVKVYKKIEKREKVGNRRQGTVNLPAAVFRRGSSLIHDFLVGSCSENAECPAGK